MINKLNNNKVIVSRECLLLGLFYIEVIDFALWGQGSQRFTALMRFKKFALVRV
jgi:hypothetical protein